MLYLPLIIGYFAAKQMAMFPVQCWVATAQAFTPSQQK